MYVYLDSFRSFIQTINAYFYFFATSSYFKFYVNTTDTQVAANEDYLKTHARLKHIPGLAPFNNLAPHN